jgi:hypothetical protein
MKLSSANIQLFYTHKCKYTTILYPPPLPFPLPLSLFIIPGMWAPECSLDAAAVEARAASGALRLLPQYAAQSQALAGPEGPGLH